MRRSDYAFAVATLLAFNFQAGLHLARSGEVLELPLQFLHSSKGQIASDHRLILIAAVLQLAGIVLTLFRLRDAGKPLALATLYVLPWVGVGLICYLMVAPSAMHTPPPDLDEERLRSRRKWESAAISAGASAVVGGGLVVLSVAFGGPYGWALFAGIPLGMGAASTLLHTRDELRSQSECLSVAVWSLLLLGIILIAAAVEGFICVLMAAPFALLLAIAGSLAAHGYRSRRGPRHAASIATLLMLVMPILMGAESAAHLTPPEWTVHSSIEIDAPPERVWQFIVAFPPAPPPKELCFRAGIAYPISATIHGRPGLGAMRTCDFSTGSFVEVIDGWEPGRRMEFSIAAEADPMVEMTPYPAIHPPHLDGYLHPRHAVFELIALPGGRTRLQGTSTYRDAIWPSQYWRLWSDYIIHSVHHRVFEHVKHLAEARP